MAYRKIEVDGLTYEYTIGRTHVKVKGVGVARIEEVGSPRDEGLLRMMEGKPHISVHPGDVARYIRSRVAS